MPATAEDFDKICKELEELKRKNDELFEELTKSESNKTNIPLQIFFSILFVSSICLVILAADSKNIVITIAGVVTALGSIYGLIYDDL